MPLPPLEGGDKEARGRVLIVGGSAESPGGALLAGVAALRAGAGKLQLGTCRSTAGLVAVAVPEARVFALEETAEGAISPEAADTLLPMIGKLAALALGPGTLGGEDAAVLARRLLSADDCPPCVLDAACMAAALERTGPKSHAPRIVITPHAGEMARLLKVDKQDVEADPQGAARRAADDLQIVVALKGAVTHVADPAGGAWAHHGGSIGLATSGSGDVLAGIIAGLLARRASLVQATLWAIHLHAEAGRRLARRYGPVGLLARELPAEIPSVMHELSG
jgi:hydroxyethylthiazole kinase-like uncharacterized protein yjeF